jgi:hypothetical protein
LCDERARHGYCSDNIVTSRRQISSALLKSLLFAICIFVLWSSAFRNGIDGDFFYDEAVYANLAEHPPFSDYYSDPVFFRHPPFIYTFYFILSKISCVRQPETLYRISSLVLASLGLVFFGLSLSAAVACPLLTAVALVSLASSPLFIKYSLSSTMYPAFFLFLQITLFGLVRKHGRLRNLGFIFLIYTHYFGVFLFALFAVSLFLKRKRLGDIFRESRAVVLACSPLAILAVVGLAYHAARSNPFHAGTNYVSLLFYVPLSGWLSLYPVFKIRDLRRIGTLRLYLFMGAVFFLALFLVVPPFKRYLYAALPLFLFSGTMVMDEAASGLASRARALLIPLAIIMYFFPAHLCAFSEQAMFDDVHEDNNRYESWKKPVEICGDRTVMTNNARSFLYYKSGADSRRYALFMLESRGTLVQFDASLKDFNEKLDAFHPECIAINDYGNSRLRVIRDHVSKALTKNCEGVFQKGAVEVFLCNWKESKTGKSRSLARREGP